MPISPKQLRHYLDLSTLPRPLTMTHAEELAAALQHAVGELLALGVPIETREEAYPLDAELREPPPLPPGVPMTLELELDSKLETANSVHLRWQCKGRSLSEAEKARLRAIDDQSEGWTPAIVAPINVVVSKFEDGFEAARALGIGHRATLLF